MDSGSPENSFIQLRGVLGDVGCKLSTIPEELQDLRSQLAGGLGRGGEGEGEGNTPDPTGV